MKAIETRYRGFRFRSRLEARWAVFFDTLGVSWEYEPEGFELKDGTRYLPDFWLPRLQCFFEVKGQSPTVEERRKTHRLSAEAQKAAVMAVGTMQVEELIVGKHTYGEWPTDGFNLEVFAGEAFDVWKTPAFDFSLWDWLIEVDLPPFIKKQYPAAIIPKKVGIEQRRSLIELDQQYYRTKYNTEHPRYRWGRYEKAVCWAKEGKDYRFALEPTYGITDISTACNAARAARFEFGECG